MTKKKKQKQKSAEPAPPLHASKTVYAVGFGAFAAGFLAAGALWQYGPLSPETAAAPVPTTVAQPRLPPARFVATDGRPARGPEDAPVTIVEFTDYECPFCRRHFQETLPQVMDRYGDRIRYVVRNFPLRSIHPQAQKAAEAAECAFEQDRFWAYHDMLFERAPALGVDELKRYAGELGLDQTSFDSCLDSGQKRHIVEIDFREAVGLGMRGTPGFFINGRAVYGAQPFEVFEAYVEVMMREGL